MNLEPDFLKILYESCTKPHINMEEWRCQPLFGKYYSHKSFVIFNNYTHLESSIIIFYLKILYSLRIPKGSGKIIYLQCTIVVWFGIEFPGDWDFEAPIQQNVTGKGLPMVVAPSKMQPPSVPQDGTLVHASCT